MQVIVAGLATELVEAARARHMAHGIAQIGAVTELADERGCAYEIVDTGETDGVHVFPGSYVGERSIGAVGEFVCQQSPMKLMRVVFMDGSEIAFRDPYSGPKTVVRSPVRWIGGGFTEPVRAPSES